MSSQTGKKRKGSGKTWQEKRQNVKDKRGPSWTMTDKRRDYEAPHAGSYAAAELAALDATAGAERERRASLGLPFVEAEEPPFPKKKVAILLGYCGAAYQGMQMNPGVNSLEAELEKALFRAKGITRSNFGNLQKISWARSARTDKGVSALAQIVSLKMALPPCEGSEASTTQLDNTSEDCAEAAAATAAVAAVAGAGAAPNARVIGGEGVVKSLLAPPQQQQPSSSPAQAAPSEEATSSATASASEVGADLDARLERMIGCINQHLPDDIKIFDILRTTNSFDAKNGCAKRRYHYLLPTWLLMPPPGLRNILDAAAKEAPYNHATSSGSSSSSGNAGASFSGGGDEEEEGVEDEGVGAEGGSHLKATGDFAVCSSSSSSSSCCDGGATAAGGSDSGSAAATNPAAAKVPYFEHHDHPERNPFLSARALESAASVLSAWRVDAATLARLGKGLALFAGTHRFHNYTNHRGSSDPSSQRHIYSFTVSTPFLVPQGSSVAPPGAGSQEGGGDGGDGDGGSSSSSSSSSQVAGQEASGGSEWVLLEVIGQSFLLHQIRKMVATIVDLSRREEAPSPPSTTPTSTNPPPPPSTAAAAVSSAASAELNCGAATCGDDGGGGGVDESASMPSVLARTLLPGKVPTPMAPSLGLYLDRPFFEGYNQMYCDHQPQKKSGDEKASVAEKAVRLVRGGEEARRPLAWDNNHVTAQLNTFQREVIWRHVFETAGRDHSFVVWANSCLDLFPNKYLDVPPPTPGWVLGHATASGQKKHNNKC